MRVRGIGKTGSRSYKVSGKMLCLPSRLCPEGSIGGWDSRPQIITIACALRCYAMQENTELTAYRKDSIRQRRFGKKMHQELHQQSHQQSHQKRHQDSILSIDNSENGSRLDRVLVRRLGAARRTLILRLIRKGNVRLNKKRCKPESRVASGDQVFLPNSLRQPEQQDSATIPASLLSKAEALPVLYEDKCLLVVNKSAGLVVHGGSGHDSGLIESLKALHNLPELRLAHRLDRDTSGVLLMAKNLESLRRLTESFRQRDMQKTYFALVAGHPFVHAGRMISKLAKGVERGGERMVVDADQGKESVTDFQVMIEFKQGGFDYAMLALNPHSGRTHQLRVQLQNEGHAILGDGKYAGKDELAAYKSIGGKGLMLHAWRLRLSHPVTGRSLDFTAPWPESWQRLLIKV